MSYLKFSPNLFLGSQELQKFKTFLDDTGFRKLFLQSAFSFGVVNNSTNGTFTNFQVSAGTNVGTIKLAAGVAIDSNGQIIPLNAIDNIAVTNDSNWYWVKIAYQASSAEPGIFSIDSNGNLSGTNGATLLSSLRGIPNIPSRVKFLNASLNTGEYDVNTVTNNASANLSGIFLNETGLTLAVVGSFTPDAVPQSSDKQIFQYDACSLTLVLETVPSTPPPLISGIEFVVARIQRVGSVITIQDKRNLNIFCTSASGTYTPTTFNAVNMTGISAQVATWIRIGNVCTISGQITFSPTTGSGTLTSVEISLPVTSLFALTSNASGAGSVNDGGVGSNSNSLLIRGVGTPSSHAELSYNCNNNTSSRTMNYIVQYQVL